MIYRMYASGLKGWVGKAKAAKHWEAVKDSGSFVPFNINNIQGSRRMMLFEVVRKVLGNDTENYPQLIGDCVVNKCTHN